MTRTYWAINRIRDGLIFSALATLLLACGGGETTGATAASAGTPTPPAPTTPETVTGVATPDSVAVVTATNVN
jgi:hypothetical protein